MTSLNSAETEVSNLVLTSTTVEQTIYLGKSVGSLLQSGDIVLLNGDLAAGKTQFTKGVAQSLNVTEEITSPTFNLVMEYPCNLRSVEISSNKPVLLRHFDLYRLERPDQLDDIDYFGLLEDKQAVSVVEWGDKFAAALPLQYLDIDFASKNSHLRQLTISAVGQRAEHVLISLPDLIGQSGSQQTNLANPGVELA